MINFQSIFLFRVILNELYTVFDHWLLPIENIVWNTKTAEPVRRRELSFRNFPLENVRKIREEFANRVQLEYIRRRRFKCLFLRHFRSVHCPLSIVTCSIIILMLKMETNYRKESCSHERSQSISILNCDNFESEPKWPLYFTISMNFLAHAVVANIPTDFTLCTPCHVCSVMCYGSSIEAHNDGNRLL